MGEAVGGIIGGIGSVAGGLLGMSGAQQTGSQVSRAAQDAAQAQLQMYYQSRQDLLPWLKAGRWALGKGATTVEDINRLREKRKGLRQELKMLKNDQGQYEYQPATSDNIVDALRGKSKELADMPAKQNALIPANTTAISDLKKRINNLTRRIQAGPQEGTGLMGLIERGPGEFIPSEQPGYEYGFNELIRKPLMQGAAAQGRFFSPGTMNALGQQAQNYASTMYDQFLNRYYQSLTPYQSLAGVGQTVGGTLGQLGYGAGGGAANALLSGGYGRAGGTLGSTNALLAMLGGLGSLGTNWAQQYYNQTPTNSWQWNSFPGWS